jgi:SAM-dependent methyltransferase
LFDQYAPSFEAALVDDLGYRGPALLLAAVAIARAAADRPLTFSRAIDLGCGTGLAARAFASIVDEIIGIDLSPRMIERARATGLYAEVDVAEIVEGLGGRPDGCADLILAADVMVYVHDMTPLLREVARDCATPTAKAACERSSPPRASCSTGWNRHRLAPRAVFRCPAWSWSPRRPELARDAFFANRGGIASQDRKSSLA